MGKGVALRPGFAKRTNFVVNSFEGKSELGGRTVAEQYYNLRSGFVEEDFVQNSKSTGFFNVFLEGPDYETAPENTDEGFQLKKTQYKVKCFAPALCPNAVLYAGQRVYLTIVNDFRYEMVVLSSDYQIFFAQMNATLTQDSSDLNASAQATLYMADEEEESEDEEEPVVKIKLSTNVITVYGALLSSGKTITSGTRVAVVFVPSLRRYEILNGSC